MELDARIKTGKKPLTVFDIEEAKNYIGKNCYFANDIASFSFISDDFKKGILTTISHNNEREPYHHDGIRSSFDSAFILPCEWVDMEFDETQHNSKEIDELKNRISKLEKSVSEMNNKLQFLIDKDSLMIDLRTFKPYTNCSADYVNSVLNRRL